VFTRSGGVWRQQGEKLVSTPSSRATLGWSVALSSDGNTAIVGGPTDNLSVGAAWVFTRSAGGVWSQQAKLVGTTIGRAHQGMSVSISGDGNTAIVGGPADAGSVGNAVGAAWVFARSTRGVWRQEGEKLVGSGAIGTASQGSSTALSGDGNTAIVGGPADDVGVGAAWAYARIGRATSGRANCYSNNLPALIRQYGGLGNAAVALGFRSIAAMEAASDEFCR
jgi:hypothetical protein